MIKRIILLLLAAAMLIGCTGCAGLSSSEEGYDTIPDSTSGKDIERAAAADNVFSLNSNSKYSLNPIIATNHANQLVCSLVYENMIELDNDFNVIPNLVKSWQVSEDGKTWTLTMETGHTFHDGTAVTPRDLRESLERSINSDRFIGRFSSFAGASYTDSDLYVYLSTPDTQFIKLLNIPVIKRGTFSEKTPTGSGPYTYNEDKTALVAFEGYKDYSKLTLDTIYLKEYTDASSIISAFEDSYIDLVVNDPSSYTNLGYASTNEVHTFATTNMHFLAFNTESTLGKMSSLRYALNYAFDRNYLVELLQGNGVAASLPMYPTCELYPTELASTLNYSLDTCVRVLDNAGIRDYDSDGLLEYMSGSPQDIELTVVVCSDSSAKAGIVNRFKDDMESIGITVVVQELTWDNYITALEDGKIKDDEVDMYYGEIKLRSNFDLSELLTEEEVDEDEDEKIKLNFARIKDATALSYNGEYLAASDLSREDAYTALCNYITTSGYIITIGFEKQQLISRRGVIKGIDPNIGNPLYNYANWEIMMD